MTVINTINGRISSLALCHPEFATKATDLAQYLIVAYQSGDTKSRFEPFESLRLPSRQDYLFHKGSSKARAWQSAHQFGLAADFAERSTGEWSWANTHDWAFLKIAAEKFGLSVPIVWDRGHVQHPMWSNWKLWMAGCLFTPVYRASEGVGVVST